MFETIDFSKSNLYILSIRFSTDGFYFSIDGTPYYIYKPNDLLSMTANFKQALKDMPCLENSFRHVDVTIDSPRFTLMPLDYFEDDQADAIYYHNLTRRDNETVRYNILPDSNVVVLFGIDSALYNLLEDKYHDVSFNAHVSTIIKDAMVAGKTRQSRHMCCHIGEHTITLVATEGGSLLSANAYADKSLSDSLYYILLSWKHLSFSQTEDELTLTGNAEACKALKEQAGKYIKNVCIMDAAENDVEATLS